MSSTRWATGNVPVLLGLWTTAATTWSANFRPRANTSMWPLVTGSYEPGQTIFMAPIVTNGPVVP